MSNVEFQSLNEFMEYFQSEESCEEFLFPLKWPSGFKCPRCCNSEYTRMTTRRLPLYQCRSCLHQTSLSVGTIMEKSRTPICKWLAAIWLVAQPHSNINAVKLSYLISVTYKTSWLMLNKIRFAIGQADTEQSLSGYVSGIVSFYGKPYNPSAHLHGQEHPFILAASLDPNGEPKYIKAKLVPRDYMSGKYVTTPAYKSFINRHSLSSSVHTTIIRERCRISRDSPFRAISKQISSWINSTFHSLGELFLQDYLDEFCFRFNMKRQSFVSHWEILTNYCLRTTS